MSNTRLLCAAVMVVVNSVCATATFAAPTVRTVSVNGVPVLHPHYATGISVDRSGNIYTASDDSAIRKITPAGAVSIVAGSTEYGNREGIATEARFCVPRGIINDSRGNLFVADSGNAVIRKIAAGSYSVETYSKGPLPMLHYQFIQGGIAIGSNDILYIADLDMQGIFKITNPNDITYVMGPWASNWRTLQHDSFFLPWAMVADSNNNLYVVDENSIRKITPIGSSYTLTTIAKLDTRLFRITIDRNGNLYGITKTSILKISPPSSGSSYTVSTFAGSPTTPGFVDGIARTARFNDLHAITCDNTDLYVIDKYETTPFNPAKPCYSYIRKISLR